MMGRLGYGELGRPPFPLPLMKDENVNQLQEIWRLIIEPGFDPVESPGGKIVDRYYELNSSTQKGKR